VSVWAQGGIGETASFIPRKSLRGIWHELSLYNIWELFVPRLYCVDTYVKGS